MHLNNRKFLRHEISGIYELVSPSVLLARHRIQKQLVDHPCVHNAIPHFITIARAIKPHSMVLSPVDGLFLFETFNCGKVNCLPMPFESSSRKVEIGRQELLLCNKFKCSKS